MYYWKNSELSGTASEGAVEVTEDEWAELIAQQPLGKQITTGADGRPVALDRPGPTLDGIKTTQIRAIESVMATELGRGVECTSGEVTLVMNAGRDSARNLRDGIEVMQQAGRTTMTLIPLNDLPVPDVPIADAIEINRQQGAHAYEIYQRYWALRYQIMTAKTAEAVQTVVWEK